MENSIDPRMFSRDLCRISIDLSDLLRTATAWSIKQSFFRYFWFNLTKKNLWFFKNLCWFSGDRFSVKSHSPPTAHIWFDRSFDALSNEILPEVQSSLFMEFLSLEYSAVEKGFQRPVVLRRIQKLLKSSDSDSSDDEEFKYIIRISIAQSRAKLRVLQRITYFKKPFRRVLGIWATVLQQDVLWLLSKNKKVLELIITQALKVSNDLVNVVYIVSQVPWNHPTTKVLSFYNVSRAE